MDDPSRRTHNPYAALRYRDFRYFAIGNLASSLGMQMLGVAVGWHVYQLTHSAMALGLIGLVQVVPVVSLSMFGGQIADRFSRRKIVLVTLLVLIGCGSLLAALSAGLIALPEGGPLAAVNRLLTVCSRGLRETRSSFTTPLVPAMYAVLFVIGVAKAFYNPAKTAILPQLVPLEVFSNAVTWNTSLFQVASMAGPALGGFVMARYHGTPAQFSSVYLMYAIGLLVLSLFVLRFREIGRPEGSQPATMRSLLAGLRFVFDHRIILATISLDLFAVLLGGATALLPIYADEILHCGPVGLGWLRAAPSVGALTMAMILAHRPPMRRAGPAMLAAVAGFGLATIVFGLSRHFALSLLALALTGMFDNISVVVRHTLVQVLTPDAMRGRVSAVNQVFISVSNEVGELESGLTAAWFGPVGSVLIGGVGTILVVLGVGWWWPEVRRFGSLADAKPLEE